MWDRAKSGSHTYREEFAFIYRRSILWYNFLATLCTENSIWRDIPSIIPWILAQLLLVGRVCPLPTCTQPVTGVCLTPHFRYAVCCEWSTRNWSRPQTAHRTTSPKPASQPQTNSSLVVQCFVLLSPSNTSDSVIVAPLLPSIVCDAFFIISI